MRMRRKKVSQMVTGRKTQDIQKSILIQSTRDEGLSVVQNLSIIGTIIFVCAMALLFGLTIGSIIYWLSRRVKSTPEFKGKHL